MRHLLTAWLTVLTLTSAPAAWADEIIVVLGLEGLGASDDRSGILGIEWHDKPMIEILDMPVSTAVAASITTDEDLFLGAGLSTRRDLGRRWFVEGSVMPGLQVPVMSDADASIELRSVIGVGRMLPDGGALSVGLGHMTNSHTDKDRFSLRIRRQF